MRRTPLEAWVAQRIGQGGVAGPDARLDRAILERHQLDRLRRTVELVRTRSSFYRRHLGSADRGPRTLSSVRDVRHLPFTTADDIRADPLGFVCVSLDEIGRVVTLDSSGTTGLPKRLYFTPADQALTVDFFRAGMSTFTGRGDRVLILLPGETPGSVGDLLATGLRELGAVPIGHGPVRDPAHTLRVAAEERATVMVGVPVHLLRLVRHSSTVAPQPDLHSVLLSTDHVPAAIVAAVERAWGCRVYNHYGMTETGLGGGVDCEARGGYHLREADLLFEVVDPATGDPIDGDAEGELVFTTLTRTGMPLVRYRTGDLARWVPGPCACGTALRTLAHVTTRVAGVVDLGGGELLTQAVLDEAVFATDGVLDFAATVGRDETGTTLAIRVRVASYVALDVARAAVAAALASIPAVVRVRAPDGPMSIEVVVGTDPVAVATLAKRSIAVDERGCSR